MKTEYKSHLVIALIASIILLFLSSIPRLFPEDIRNLDGHTFITLGPDTQSGIVSGFIMGYFMALEIVNDTGNLKPEDYAALNTYIMDTSVGAVRAQILYWYEATQHYEYPVPVAFINRGQPNKTYPLWAGYVTEKLPKGAL